MAKFLLHMRLLNGIGMQQSQSVNTVPNATDLNSFVFYIDDLLKKTFFTLDHKD